MDWAQFLKDNWTVITQAPWAFVACATLFLSLGLWISGRLSAGAHETKDQRLALAEERVAEYKEKLSGASPDQAKAELIHLREMLEGIASYGVLKEREGRVLEILNERRFSITITRDVDAADADRLYRQMLGLFKKAEWVIVGDGVIIGIDDPPDCGVTLLAYRETRQESVVAARRALEVAGLEFVERHLGEDGPSLHLAFSTRKVGWHPRA